MVRSMFFEGIRELGIFFEGIQMCHFGRPKLGHLGGDPRGCDCKVCQWCWVGNEPIPRHPHAHTRTHTYAHKHIHTLRTHRLFLFSALFNLAHKHTQAYTYRNKRTCAHTYAPKQTHKNLQTRTHTRMQAHTHTISRCPAHTHTSTPTPTQTHKQICVYIYTKSHKQTRAHAHTSIHTPIHARPHPHIHTPTNTQPHTHTHTHTQTHTRTNTHTHKHTHTRTHTYTLTHTHVLTLCPPHTRTVAALCVQSWHWDNLLLVPCAANWCRVVNLQPGVFRPPPPHQPLNYRNHACIDRKGVSVSQCAWCEWLCVEVCATCECARINTRQGVCACACVYVCVWVCVYTYIYIYICTNMTYVYKYSHRLKTLLCI